MNTTKKNSLLNRFDIPISHLDFNYIKSCKNSKEIEKILRILYSGEEGYFPDLTKCAEDHLRELKPDSIWLRTENLISKRGNFQENEWKKINEPFAEWSNEIKIKDKLLSNLSETACTDDQSDDDEKILPPIRGKEIKIECDKKKDNIQRTTTIANKTDGMSHLSRIKSTDYRQWDKYDADVEVLKIDFEEERLQQEYEIKMNLKKREMKNKLKIQEIDENSNNNSFDMNLEKLTDIEKENLAIKFKDIGNDYYRAGEYESAVTEYTKNIKIFPSATGYNNRAMAFLKLKQYEKCVEDCNNCLNMDPKNTKAMYRKGQALTELNRKNEAYEIFSHIISLEPSNATVNKILNKLKKDIDDLQSLSPPTNATRIQIKEESSSTLTTKTNSAIKSINKNQNTSVSSVSQGLSNVKSNKTETVNNCDKKQKTKNEEEEEDISKLIIPNRIVKSGLKKTIEKIDETFKDKTNLKKTNTNQSNFNLNLLSSDSKKNHNQIQNKLIQEM